MRLCVEPKLRIPLYSKYAPKSWFTSSCGTIRIVKIRFRFSILKPMKHDFTRRRFLAASTLFTASLGVQFVSGFRKAQGAAPPPAFNTRLHKALIISRPTEDDFRRLKDAGFEGVEGGVIPPQEAEKCRAVAEKLGMRIHSVLRGW